MFERDTFAWAQSALRDRFRLDERLQFLITGRCRARLVVAEKLPCRDGFEFQSLFHQCKVGQRGTFPQAFAKQLCASFLHADAVGGLGI